MLAQLLEAAHHDHSCLASKLDWMVCCVDPSAGADGGLTTTVYILWLYCFLFELEIVAETCLIILTHYLKQKTLFTLYIDAIGSLVSKRPEQTKRVLYYSFTLPGNGPYSSHLPGAEMLITEHPARMGNFFCRCSFFGKFSLKILNFKSEASWDRLWLGPNAQCVASI